MKKCYLAQEGEKVRQLQFLAVLHLEEVAAVNSEKEGRLAAG
jgi:hypothetical protein